MLQTTVDIIRAALNADPTLTAKDRSSVLQKLQNAGKGAEIPKPTEDRIVKSPLSGVRLATLDQLRRDVLPNFISPIPSNETLRAWFDSANIPRFKSNQLAKRGGGPCFYSVAAVEKLLRQKTTAPIFG